MNVTATDDVARLMEIAQSIRNIDNRIFRHAVETRLSYERERLTEQRLNRNREQLLLEQMFYAKARTKAVMIKGTNVDLYI